MPWPIPTVKIEDPEKPGDYIVINESDFDADKHTLFQEPAAEEEAPEEVDGEEAAEEAEAKRKPGRPPKK